MWILRGWFQIRAQAQVASSIPNGVCGRQQTDTSKKIYLNLKKWKTKTLSLQSLSCPSLHTHTTPLPLPFPLLNCSVTCFLNYTAQLAHFYLFNFLNKLSYNLKTIKSKNKVPWHTFCPQQGPVKKNYTCVPIQAYFYRKMTNYPHQWCNLMLFTLLN